MIPGIAPVALPPVENLQEILGSPLRWAETYITNPKNETPFEANVVQRQFMDSDYRLNVVRVHRRAGKSYGMAVLCIYYCMNLKKGEVLYLAPRMNQVQAFWDELERFIEEHPFIKASVTGGTKKPYMKSFDNGTILKGFTTGSSSNGKANGIRGLGADVIFLDEVAMMSDGDFDAITPILEGDKYRRFKPIVYAASTPQGSMGKFYEWCTEENSAWYQVCVPITENPMFSEADLVHIRKQCNERQWETEYLVKFLDVGLTVFALSLIRDAQIGAPYAVTPKPKPEVEVEGMPPVKRVWRTMGVDWDKLNEDGSGPNIAILEVDERPGKNPVPRVIYREHIPQGPQCLHDSVERIKALNYAMDPDIIFCDAGQGELQIEELHLYGKKNTASKLHKRVQRVHFGGSATVIDPGTNQPIKKKFKTYMVNLLVKWFEDHQLVFAANDEVFRGQLVKYKVVNQTENATTYSKKDEHIIDAVGLAVAAMFQIHKSPFKSNRAHSIHIMPMPERVPANSLTASEKAMFDDRDPMMSKFLGTSVEGSQGERKQITPTLAVELEPRGRDTSDDHYAPRSGAQQRNVFSGRMSSRKAPAPFRRNRF